MKKNNKLNGVSARCMGTGTTIKNEGGFLAKTTAGDYISNYLEGVDDENGISHNFGFVFGLKHIKSIINKINDYNDGLPAAEQIEGIRIYLGRKEPIVKGAELPMDQVLDTLLITPVMYDGTDLYKMPPLTDPDMILGDPRPCPNECIVLSFVAEKFKAAVRN